MIDHTALIARLAAATEGGEELDVAICRAYFGYSDDTPITHVMPYSRSVDAALGLMPEGWRFRLWQHHTGPFGADIFPTQGGSVYRSHDVSNAALALVIAILLVLGLDGEKLP